ncbi:salicylate synthase [Nocardia alba]|uniref:Salicylate synthetase n=1 Tax=Nocardia alba TaxID=225051 RepID=A0A4R1FRK1_9NOCA|nr:salicylate synthase [Nocardia alba]TCJ94958.1 salicylate synthetase [Nocardia alba]
MIEYDFESFVFAHDPIASAVGLARDAVGDYVLYESGGEWCFAAGELATVTMDARRIHSRCDGTEHVQEWSGSPSVALHTALASLPIEDWHAYGQVNFGFAELLPHVRRRGAAPPSGTLVRLIVPRVEVRLDGHRVSIRSVAAADRDRVRAHLATPARPGAHAAVRIDVQAEGSAYRTRVAQAVKEIRQGQYQKVILSRSVRLPFPVDLPATYELGRRANTPARSFLLRLDGAAAAGFSPEVIVTVDEDRRVATQPLAGTRAFGRGAQADAAARAELETDPKEIYEHAVSVRTAVEEMRPICAPTSVGVEEFMGVRERGSVQHLASLVQGVLADDRTAWDALEALFPAVTASGIPKRESLDAIARMDEPRGLYSGAVLRISHDGSLDAALVLRAVYQAADGAWLRAGAGIVADSDPEREFEETCEKLASIAPYIVRE